MKVLIIEDEVIAAESLVKYLGQLNSNFEIVGTLPSIEWGRKWFENNPTPDLIISDIMLLDGQSFQLFSEFKPRCPIIFTTAYDQFAIKAFQANAIDYLLKPISKEKLALSLKKFQHLGRVEEPIPKMPVLDYDKLAASIEANSKKYKSRFLVKLGQKIKAVPVDKIAYVFTEDKLSFLVTNSSEKFPLDYSLEEIEGMLDPDLFFRANRKFVVHIDAVKEIHPYFKGRLKLELTPFIEDGLVISSEKTPAFKSWLDR